MLERETEGAKAKASQSMWPIHSWNGGIHAGVCVYVCELFPGGSDGRASACNARDPGSIPGLGRSPGGGNGNPLQYSCLGNPMEPDRLQFIGLQRVGHN